jgi:hypothetical protein
MGWSHWRRRHQAVAQDAHARRQQDAGVRSPQPATVGGAAHAKEPAAWLVEAGKRLMELLPRPLRSGRPRQYSHQEMLAAIVHVLQTGCGWERLPRTFPPYRAVHTQYRRWKASGLWTKLWDGVEPPFPACYLQL